MTKKALMGIENEFVLVNEPGHQIDGNIIYRDILAHLSVPYFEKSLRAIRLATGGAFYIDSREPEITTAPYILEPGASTAVSTNLILNRNVVAEALDKLNKSGNNGKYQLNGYSAHYNFTFDEFASDHHVRNNLCYLLARSVNPALQLFLENRHSGGIMFRNRNDGRVEICADYIPNLEDNIAAVGFQSAMLFTINDWLKKGATIEDVSQQLSYLLPTTELRVIDSSYRPGYILKTPQVIRKGRKGLVQVIDEDNSGNSELSKKMRSRFIKLLTLAVKGHTMSPKEFLTLAGKDHAMFTQELLEHYGQLFEPAMDKVLNEQEKKLVVDSIQKSRALPIDHRGYPKGYFNVGVVPVDPQQAQSPLTTALENAVKPRTVGHSVLTPTEITWEKIIFSASPNYETNIKLNAALGNFEYPAKSYQLPVQLNISLDDLTGFDALATQHPELLDKLIKGTLTEKDKKLLLETYRLSVKSSSFLSDISRTMPGFISVILRDEDRLRIRPIPCPIPYTPIRPIQHTPIISNESNPSQFDELIESSQHRELEDFLIRNYSFSNFDKKIVETNRKYFDKKIIKNGISYIDTPNKNFFLKKPIEDKVEDKTPFPKPINSTDYSALLERYLNTLLENNGNNEISKKETPKTPFYFISTDISTLYNSE